MPLSTPWRLDPWIREHSRRRRQDSASPPISPLFRDACGVFCRMSRHIDGAISNITPNIVVYMSIHLENALKRSPMESSFLLLFLLFFFFFFSPLFFPLLPSSSFSLSSNWISIYRGSEPREPQLQLQCTQKLFVQPTDHSYGPKKICRALCNSKMIGKSPASLSTWTLLCLACHITHFMFWWFSHYCVYSPNNSVSGFWFSPAVAIIIGVAYPSKFIYIDPETSLKFTEWFRTGLLNERPPLQVSKPCVHSRGISMLLTWRFTSHVIVLPLYFR